jgi:hypothetical protein
MGKIYETKVRDFTGGITNDPRDDATGVAQMITNFDIFTDYKRAIPYRDVEDGNSAQSTAQIQAYCVALRTGTTYSLYGLGVDSGHPYISYKNITTGAANDLDDNAWNLTANSIAASGSTSYDCFVFYPRTGRIYGGHLSSNIWKYDPTGVAAFVDTELSISYSTIAQGLVHSQDDILYIPYDNKIAKNDNGSWTATALTLPTEFYITSICELGALLAIAAAPKSGIGTSRVYLWDRDSTLETVSENIDWGTGILKVLENIENTLIGISLANDVTRNKHRVIFRRYDGYGAVKFRELTSSSITDLKSVKQKIDNRLHFMLAGTFAGAVREGIWTIGRPSPDKPFALVHSHTPNNDTALGAGVLKGFYILGDYVFTSYINNSSVAAMSKTLATATYTKKAIYESVIFSAKDSAAVKSWKGYSSTFEPLTSNAQVVSKYKKDEETSFTTIQTENTTSAISRSSATIDSAGSLPEHKELAFRLESTNGAVITGYSFEQEVEESKPY